MPSKRDYYETLEISRNASEDEIKRAYRKLAKKYHPDANPNNKNAEEKFKEVNEAYEVLRDARKRSAYDQFGHAGVNTGAQGGGAGGFSGGFSDAGDMGDIFSDIFEGFFGGSSRSRSRSHSRARRGSDLRYDLSISFLDSAQGKEVQLKIPRMETCEECKGSGARAGTNSKVCSTCQGAGQVRMSQGFFSVMRTCPTCEGEGEVIDSPCRACGGQGRKQVVRNIEVKIPKGVDNGSRLKIMGEGEAGIQGGPRGDLYVVIQVEPHDIFTREEDDVLCQVPISFVVAALGGEVEVPTLTGKVSLKIPAGTQTDKKFRLRGKGFTNLRGLGLGDQIVTVKIVTPEKLNDKQKQLLKEFDNLTKDNTQPLIKKFKEKVSELFKK